MFLLIFFKNSDRNYGLEKKLTLSHSCVISLLSKNVAQNSQDFGRDKDGQVNKTYYSRVSITWVVTEHFFLLLHSILFFKMWGSKVLSFADIITLLFTVLAAWLYSEFGALKMKLKNEKGDTQFCP